MKLQVCYYKAKRNDSWLRGVAVLSIGFSVGDVDYIIDQDGNKLPECWDYALIEVPVGFSGYGYSVIDTDLFAMNPSSKISAKVSSKKTG